MPTFAERVLRVTRALEAARIPYAVGGAIALNYYAEPRATKDIDVNVFLDASDAERVLRVILDLGALRHRSDAHQGAKRGAGAPAVGSLARD